MSMAKAPLMQSLQARNRSSGFAQRTLKNLDFVKRRTEQCDVHLVTQVINSLLGLLVFPFGEEEAFFKEFRHLSLSSVDLDVVRDALKATLPIPSLTVTKFGRCKDVTGFFRRLRNAIAHKGIKFFGDPDSRFPAEVVVVLRDRRNKDAPYDWEISMTAQDLEELSRYIAERIIEKNL
jgi:hypothetical protein